MFQQSKSDIKLEKVLKNYRIQNSEDMDIHLGKYTKQIYFDSYDIIRLLQGLWGINKADRVNIEGFKKNNNLIIYGALARNWLGKVKLLKPHQDEFLLKLTDSELLFPNDKDIFNLIKLDFLNRIELNDISYGQAGKDRIKHYFDKFNLNSETLFKVNFLLNPIHWHERYKKYNNVLFEFEDEEFSYENYSNSAIFKKALKAFSKYRPSQSAIRSNYLDSIAIAQLQEKVDNFNEGKTKVLPIFYASSPKMIEVLRDLQKKPSNFLMLKNNNTVVREFDFFKIDIVFNALNNPEIGKYVNDVDNIKKSYRKEFANSRFSLDSKKSLQLIEDNVNVNFYEKVFFDQNGYQEIIETLRQEDRLPENMSGETIKADVVSLKEDLKERYQKDIDYIKGLNKLWSRLHDIKLEQLTDLIPEKRKIDPFTDFALTRFPISDAACVLIEENIENLTNSVKDAKTDEDVMEEFHTSLVNQLAACLSSKEFTDQHITLFIILWVLGEYDTIINLSDLTIKKLKLFEKEPDLYNFQEIGFLSIYAASIPESSRPDIKTLKKVIKLFKSISNPNIASYKLDIAVSYLSFQLWKQYTVDMILPELQPHLLEKYEKHSRFFEDALYYCRKAMSRLDEFEEDDSKSYRRRKYYYCLNSYLYYVVKGGSAKMFAQSERNYLDLRGIEDHSYLWQGRFWDTLGWYNVRKALIPGVNKEKAQIYLVEARRFNDKCFVTPNTKREMKAYEFLKNTIDTIVNR